MIATPNIIKLGMYLFAFAFSASAMTNAESTDEVKQETLDVKVAASKLDYRIAITHKPADLEAVYAEVNGKAQHDSADQLYMTFLAQRIGIMYMQSDAVKAEKYFSDCVKYGEAIDESKKEAAEAYALMSMCYGLHIGIKPMQAPMLGSLSLAAMDSAIALDGNNPHVLLLAGMKDHFTLPMWGGSNKRAKERFIKSLEIAKSSARWQWLESDLLAYLVLVEIKLNQPCEAQRYYEEAKIAEPESGLLKHVVKKSVDGVTCNQELAGNLK